MIEPKTAVVELQSRLGRVGSIVAYDPWDSRKSVLHAKWWVSKIARLSHGLGEAEDFEAHFDRVVNQMKHESVLEFVPWISQNSVVGGQLPQFSLRGLSKVIGADRGLLDDAPQVDEAMSYLYHSFGKFALPEGCYEHIAVEAAERFPASAFLVEAPIFVARQWMRHRSFAYLEMSRRYTKGSRVPLEFYGDGWDCIAEPVGSVQPDGKIIPRNLAEWAFWDACKAEYERRLSIGWPQEIARGCLPVETMTKWWVAGFDRDWEAFLKLRDDAHAQPEIRVFAGFIRSYLKAKKEIAG